mmetsp:Transcript_16303/g.37623  ORF Transcript_16303/g.37623 Transcript_16303/m.37623 type:complete len:152 (+) Transcript_16303:62-517(+)
MDDDLDVSRWNILYPNYIDSRKRIPQGRRIPVANAVEAPRAAEMAEICQFLEIPHVLEMDKAYPRDWMIKGRLRVLLKTPEGAFTHAEIQTKDALMKKMGELIPKLKTRVQGASGSKGGNAAQEMVVPNQTRGAKKEAKREEKKAQKKAKK